MTIQLQHLVPLVSVTKLDRVALLITDPPPTTITTLSKKIPDTGDKASLNRCG